jgi:hypothetical protein
MLQKQLADLNADLIAANSKYEAKQIKDDISVVKAQISLCKRDLARELA